MQPTVLRRIDRGHVLMSDGWAVRLPLKSLASPFVCDRSLQSNGLNDDAKRALQEAAGERVKLSF